MLLVCEDWKEHPWLSCHTSKEGCGTHSNMAEGIDFPPHCVVMAWATGDVNVYNVYAPCIGGGLQQPRRRVPSHSHGQSLFGPDACSDGVAAYNWYGFESAPSRLPAVLLHMASAPPATRFLPTRIHTHTFTRTLLAFTHTFTHTLHSHTHSLTRTHTRTHSTHTRTH